jgi:secretion/DNA translocation related CpaE-like protein
VPGKVVVVVGAVGGVGASTLAALLAASMAPGPGTAVLIDGDPSHGGVEVLLGVEGQQGARWSDLGGVRAAIDAGDLAGVLPRWRGVEVLSADRRAAVEPAAVQAVLDSLVVAREAVVVDVPAHVLLGRPPAALLSLIGSNSVLVVTGQDVLGVCAALMVREAVGPSRARLVLRRRRHPRVAPAEAAAVVGLPVAAMLPTDRRMAGAVEAGLGPMAGGWSPLARAVTRLARGLGDG